jgi:DegV family protein with EDD domain
MRIVTNPGSNLPAEVIRHYDLSITPQKIVVDGVAHDTRDIADSRVVDEWVRTAKEHPHVVGTSAAEFVTLFRQLAAVDREILAIMTSRKIIGSYAAAVSAAGTFQSVSMGEGTSVDVFDTETTDLGAGLVTIFAAEASRAGLPRRKVLEAVEAFSRRQQMLLTVETLDNLVKGGRASFLRAWVADFLHLRPLISFVDGVLKSIGQTSRDGDVERALAERLVQSLGKGRPVWAGIVHGGAPEKGESLARKLAARLDVRYAIIRPFSPSIHLHVGPGAVGAMVYPIDNLPWAPPVPPRF